VATIGFFAGPIGFFARPNGSSSAPRNRRSSAHRDSGVSCTLVAGSFQGIKDGRGKHHLVNDLNNTLPGVHVRLHDGGVAVRSNDGGLIVALQGLISLAGWQLNSLHKVVGGVRVSHNVVPQDIRQKGRGQQLVHVIQPKFSGEVIESLVGGHERGHLDGGVLEGILCAGGLDGGNQNAEFVDLGGGLQNSGGGILSDALRVALVEVLGVGGVKRRGERQGSQEHRE